MEENIKRGDSNRIAREYLDSLLVETRYIDSLEASTEFELFGEKFAMPVMTAALSHLDTFARPGGMNDLAKGARDAGAVMWMGMADLAQVESCAATGARIVEIIKPYADRDQVFLRIEQAKELGLLAVGVDVDFVYDRNGEAKIFHGDPLREMTSEELREIASFAGTAGLPFIVKGILSVQDARKAALAGASGLVVSHHGYSMDYAVPPLFMLRKLAGEELPGKPLLFADCEIQTGADAYKALALGAAGVSIGRPLMAAIREKGAAGVTEYLREAAGQLKKMMIGTGCRTIGEIDPSVLYQLPKNIF